MMLIDPAPGGVWPVTVVGWVTALVAFSGVSFLMYDRLRGSGQRDAEMQLKISALVSRMDVLEHELTTIETNLDGIDRKVTEVLFELRGPDGQNGVKGVAKGHGREIVAIKKRLAAFDVIAALFRAERDTYQGEERRHIVRRIIDGKLIDLAKADAEENDDNS